jgi:tetratricopeptide (TPR) repeat protein
LAIDEQIVGPDHPDIAIRLNNLARVLLEQRKFAQALPLLTRSANIYLAQRSDTHDDLAFVFSNLALTKQGLGANQEADTLFKRALKAAQVHNNRLIAPIMTDLAGLHCARGDSSGGLAMLARATPIMVKQYPDDAWRSAWVENTRGACLLRQNKVAAARQLILSSAPTLLKRWPPQSLYGFEVQRRVHAIPNAG